MLYQQKLGINPQAEISIENADKNKNTTLRLRSYWQF